MVNEEFYKLQRKQLEEMKDASVKLKDLVEYGRKINKIDLAAEKALREAEEQIKVFEVALKGR